VARHAAPSGISTASTAVRSSGMIRAVSSTACFNIGSSTVSALGGAVLARALGPMLKGDYAAIVAWFGIVLMLGDLGQPAALCYYVARQPRLARDYVATSRAMMIASGSLVLVIGLLLAPLLGRGQPELILAYRIVFGGAIVSFVGASYMYALQARNRARWNVIRVSQPVLGFVAIGGMWAAHALTLDRAAAALVATSFLQLAGAYYSCCRTRLAPGRARAARMRPLLTYGISQIASLTPYTLNASLDQLLLSQLVQAADLGRYAIAVSITLVPLPLVSAIGYVAFPRLAAQKTATAAGDRLMKLAVVGSASIAAVVLLPVVLLAGWLVPLVFGPLYAGAVPLVWILAPGGVFLACGQVTGDLLRGRRNPTVVAYSQWLAAVATVALLVALLPVLGITAAAVASTVSYGIALAAMTRALWRTPPQARRRAVFRPDVPQTLSQTP
jgi:O-antigen/teichoic acid export membrane protein